MFLRLKYKFVLISELEIKNIIISVHVITPKLIYQNLILISEFYNFLLNITSMRCKSYFFNIRGSEYLFYNRRTYNQKKLTKYKIIIKGAYYDFLVYDKFNLFNYLLKNYLHKIDCIIKIIFLLKTKIFLQRMYIYFSLSLVINTTNV